MRDIKELALIAVIVATTLHLQCCMSAGSNEKSNPLVVAPEHFHAALGPFLEHKQSLLPTKLVALENSIEFDSKTRSLDAPERLKRFLYDAWQNEGVGYVLLVGDVDVLPIRYMVLDRVTPDPTLRLPAPADPAPDPLP